MAAALLTVDDLTSFAPDLDPEQAEQLVADAVALAILYAPCLADTDVDHPLTAIQVAQAKAVLRDAVLRKADTGTGAVSSQTMGPFGAIVDTRQTRRTLFWPSEIEALQEICKAFGGSGSGGAFSIDTAAPPIMFHSALCGWAGGPCTCGVGDNGGWV